MVMRIKNYILKHLPPASPLFLEVNFTPDFLYFLSCQHQRWMWNRFVASSSNIISSTPFILPPAPVWVTSRMCSPWETGCPAQVPRGVTGPARKSVPVQISHMVTRGQFPHCDLHPGLQENLCSGTWRSSSTSAFTDFDVSRVVSLIFSLLSPTAIAAVHFFSVI